VALNVNVPAAVDELIARVADTSGFSELAAAWEWLLPEVEKCELLLVTALGDAFLRAPTGEVLFLNVGSARVDFVAPNQDFWLTMLSDPDAVATWFAPDLVASVRSKLGQLKPDMVYYPLHPPALGGEWEPENFDTRRWDAYLWVEGHIHRQVKDLPPGTPVTLKFDRW
jgi:hypothetical protein